MKKNKYFFGFLISVIIAPFLLAWGTYGHEHINKAAIMALPSPLLQFFYNHADFITTESTVPDLRKYTINDKPEFARHYIDLENFTNIQLPATYTEVQKIYRDSFLQKNGILPWYIVEQMDKLTKAFKEKRKTEILFLAADLGHYIADAHMPLHTSVNHDGQFTNQKGIHSFWESQLPQLFGDDYNYYTGGAKYIADINAETWRIIYASNLLVDSLLIADKEVTKQFDGKNIYALDSSGAPLKNKFKTLVHSKAYAEAFNKKLNGMVENQLRLAIVATSSFWYTAWVNAGRPDVGQLDIKELTTDNAKQLKKELKLWREGKLNGLDSEKEF